MLGWLVHAARERGSSPGQTEKETSTHFIMNSQEIKGTDFRLKISKSTGGLIKNCSWRLYVFAKHTKHGSKI